MSIDIIKDALGHETWEQTYRNLGISVKETTKEEEKVPAFLQQVEESEKWERMPPR